MLMKKVRYISILFLLNQIGSVGRIYCLIKRSLYFVWYVYSREYVITTGS